MGSDAMRTGRRTVDDRIDPAAKMPPPLPVSGAIDADWVMGRLLMLVFVCGLLYAVWTASIGWGNTLNDRHSFRQTQTAMSTEYMIGKPFRLAYETPVLGKPWSIPMEFPLYQWIVARIVGLFGTPLDQTGRFVSLGFFLLTTIPLYRLARTLGVSAHHAWVPLILFVTSPFYIFWSRTFMIESTALFFAVAYLAASLEVIKGGGWWAVPIAVACGGLAALVKVTTYLVFLAPIATLAARAAWIRWRNATGRLRVADVAGLVLVTVIPFIAAVAWVKYSADVRRLNPIAAEYLASARQIPWNFGTWEQKTSWQVWLQILNRCHELLGIPVLAGLLLGASLAIFMVVGRRRLEALACLACYLLGPVVFTNLYLVHDYYSSAHGVFLIGIVAFAIISLLESFPRQVAAWSLLALALVAAISGHRLLNFFPWQAAPNGEILQAAEYIQSTTPDDSVIVCVGTDWSPLVPYYAKRRALMIPIEPTIDPALVAQAMASLRGEKVSAIVALEPVAYPVQRAKQQLQDAGFDVPVLSVKGLPFR